MKTEEIEKYLAEVKSYIDSINRKEIAKAANIIWSTIESGHKIFIVGNGGSASIAMHFAEDLLLGNSLKGKVFHLSNIANLTAISNDFKYEDVFVKQLEKYMDPGDLLITISCSGLSANVIKAIEYANKIGYTLSISGFHGGWSKRNSDYYIYVRTKVGSYEATEDVLAIICHTIARIIKDRSEDLILTKK